MALWIVMLLLLLTRLLIQGGMTPNCTATVDVNEAGEPTCDTILNLWGLTLGQFYAWNPSVGADCTGMWAGEY